MCEAWDEKKVTGEEKKGGFSFFFLELFTDHARTTK